MDEFKHQKANDTFLFSINIKSLFTNVLLNEVNDICADTLNALTTSLFSFLVD